MVEKWLPVYRRAVEDYETEHPHWRIEVLVSLIKWALRSLKYYIEDSPRSKITWEDPFVELHYPMDWNWSPRSGGDIARGGHVFGKITKENTASKIKAARTLGEIMAKQLTGVGLAEATNWAWYEKLDCNYTPVLPVELSAELNAIKGKRARREAFDELVRPFSIGATRVDIGDLEFKPGTRASRRVAKRLAESNQQMDIPGIRFSGDVNGRKFDMGLVFEIHPLIADYAKRKAYHPIVVGLAVLNARLVRDEVVQDTPANWAKSDREEFWEELLREVEKITALLVPQAESQESVILSINSTLKIPADHWQPDNRSAEIKKVADALAQIGAVDGLKVESSTDNDNANRQDSCPVCAWIHDAGFSQFKTKEVDPFSLPGRLPEIVGLVHETHEKGFPALSTKDDALLKVCGGYGNPCKAFDDLNRRAEYKLLFDTRKRGFISIRGAVGRNRNKSEASPE